MSANDSAGLTDEVHVTLNGVPLGQSQPIPSRPADGASVAAWVDYVVALGADRTFVTADTEHFDGNERVVAAPLRRGDLIELADRLGG